MVGLDDVLSLVSGIYFARFMAAGKLSDDTPTVSGAADLRAFALSRRAEDSPRIGRTKRSNI